MADLSRHLPLSNRPAQDESNVSGDRRAALVRVVEQAAALSTEGGDASRFLAEAGLDGEFAGRSLDEVAAAVAAGPPRSIRALTDAVRAALSLAGDRPVDLDPVTTGSVALYAVGRAPFDRRAVVGGCTLRATDAGWEFGRGPERAAPARQILDFALGLADVPPPLTTRR
ncbi:hypothetical protein [Microbacterium sp. T2.11-28]|uniref:hypothetical protein n=1 Tax=Microbacterium sp. T2.11-28 TaxID=3041169 RepID=UPI0024774C7C|nr:hypothetical protein [Microbacterium sp. T2.11-28]CAI9386925.1 hypothetical protein MICABA_00674 [Microbacterium sp. T2.11-28]